MAGKYRLTTFGCKVNQYESQLIRQTLEACGLQPAARDETPDLAVVNTCAVTAAAVSDNRRGARRAAAGGQTAVIVVGCGASADADQLRLIPGVASVIGHGADVATEIRTFLVDRLRIAAAETASTTHHRTSAAALLPAAFDASLRSDAGRPTRGTPASRILPRSDGIIPLRLHGVKNEDAGPPRDGKAALGAPGLLVDRIEAFAGHQRAFLKIQDGCDAHCSYCIIPRLRPTLRSKPVETVVAEARALVHAGHKEIILTGIFLGAYGRPTAIRRRLAERRSPLVGLIEAVADVEGLERLRLSSLEPGDVDGPLLEVLATRKACMPHLHLPLQSGSVEILRRMNRQYTRDEFIAMIDRVRAALDRPAITTDIIVGFPGESDADFEASLDVARYAEFCKIHAFPFSPREHTAATRWQDRFVSPTVLKNRMGQLADIERQCSRDYRSKLIGARERVIVEGGNPSSADSIRRGASLTLRMMHGRADRYFEIHFEADETLRVGDVVALRIDRVTPVRTHGTILSPAMSHVPLPVLRAGAPK